MLSEPKAYLGMNRCECYECNKNFANIQTGIPIFDPETTSTIDIKRALGFTETNSLLYLCGNPIMYEYETIQLMREQLCDSKLQ